MSQRIKFIAFICCLLPLLEIAATLHRPSTSLPPLRRTDGKFESRPAKSSWPNAALILIALGLAGSVVLIIDAFKREYDGPKAFPIALAIVGILSFGLTSIVYYAIWGWLPTKREYTLADAFCTACVAATLDGAEPATSTINGLLGSRLIGHRDSCPQCGSTVKTHWFLFVVPLFPFASYRVLPIGRASFDRSSYIGRKLPKLCWPQIVPLWAVSILAAGLLVYVVWR